MTICIAAKCSLPSGLHGIVYATDRQITLTDLYLAYEGGTKARMLTFQWRAMYAGNILVAQDVIERAKSTLEKGEQLHSADFVKRATVEAFCAARDAAMESQILRPIGYSRERFEQVGAVQLGASEMERLNKQMSEFDLGLTLLVFGFHKNIPCIFTVDNPGEAIENDTTSFAAIGSGKGYTWGSLLPLNADAPLEQVLYRVCEAKFLAEYDTGVGKTTVLAVLRPLGIIRTIDAKSVEAAKTAWRDEVLAVPPKAVADILMAPYNLIDLKYQMLNLLLSDEEKRAEQEASGYEETDSDIPT